MVNSESKALSPATKHAIPQEFAGKWVTIVS